MKTCIRSFAAGVTFSLCVLVVAVTGAGAAPGNAPTHGSGTFSCSDGSSGTFVNNDGNSHDQKQPWIPGFVTFADGSTGVFITDSLVITVNGTVVLSQSKGNAPGPITCDVPVFDAVITGKWVAVH
jgi:hypothetical protein